MCASSEEFLDCDSQFVILSPLSFQVPHLCSVCVCVRIHTHTHTYTPTRVKNREDTDNTPFFPVITPHAKQQALS